jgi:acyl-CoA thioester hydrolase
MATLSDSIQLRIRYGETDQMGTFYNARALDWFECGRTELMRHRLAMSYAELEAKGAYLPVVEAHLEYLSGARYDDLLTVSTSVCFLGRAKLRFDMEIHAEDQRLVVKGYTIHAFTNNQGRPIRPPVEFVGMFNRASQNP